MSMRGIDISNWQAGLSLYDCDIDFAIMKATEGLNFVDQYCDDWVQQCKNKDICWGFYHYANANDPIDEANFFVNETSNYFHDGLPILDIEDSSIEDWGWFADAFAKQVHELTGVWPIIYCSASQLPRFADYDVWRNCGLWVAGYPYPATDWVDGEPPYDLWPWNCVCMWQFTSSLQMCGFSLDGDIAYLTTDEWLKYVNPNGEEQHEQPAPYEPPSYDKSIDDLAHEVILGEWGNGDERCTMLENAGYNYDVIQDRVNELYNVADAVIRGEWGNGDERYNLLTQSGYNYDTVQYIVNTLIG